MKEYIYQLGVRVPNEKTGFEMQSSQVIFNKRIGQKDVIEMAELAKADIRIVYLGELKRASEKEQVVYVSELMSEKEVKRRTDIWMKTKGVEEYGTPRI